VTGLLSRAGSFFVEPAAPSARAAAAPTPAVDLAVVVAAPSHARAAAGGVAAALRRAAGARTAVVCRNEWPDSPDIRAAGDEASDRLKFRDTAAPAGGGLALPAAARLARRLAARGIAASAAGALCHVVLPPAPDAAVREAWRVMAAAADAPVVVTVTTRTDELDAFLAQADRLYLATDAEDAYAELALASLAALGPPAVHLRPPTGLVARRAAALGLVALRPRPKEAPA
jgi:hypothetical protein